MDKLELIPEDNDFHNYARDVNREREEEVIRVKKESTAKTVYDLLIIVPGFKEWIEQTQLFNVIKEEINPETRMFKLMGIPPSLLSDEVRMQLVDRKMYVTKAEDLPSELILQFFINSPFNRYNNKTDQDATDNQKQIGR